jgi:glycosyltransferase involved in cell wall biosynthesis
MAAVAQEQADTPSGDPLISVVTPCLNSEETIERTLESLLDQRFREFESVIIDGRSEDCTLDIVRAYSKRFKQAGIRFSFTSKEDGGIYDAINRGIARSRGTIVGILNSDDWYEPHALGEVSRAYARSPGAGIFYGFLRKFKEEKELVIYRYNYDYILSNLESGIHSAVQHPACFVRRSVYDDIGAYDTSFRISADYDFLLRAKRRGVEFIPVDSILTNFALGGASSKMTQAERLKQKSRAQYKNGLLSEPEYRKRCNELRYRRLNTMKRRVVRWLFRF